MIRGPQFPGSREFHNSYWMFRHPLVCQISYEELVGPKGGGDPSRQLRAIERVLHHLSINIDAGPIADRLYNASSFTFNKGQIGRWKEFFSDDHLAAFHEEYGRITELYGYHSTRP